MDFMVNMDTEENSEADSEGAGFASGKIMAINTITSDLSFNLFISG